MRLNPPHILLISLILSSSCNAVKPTVEESNVFKSLNQINYPFAEIKNGNGTNTISDFLQDEEISNLENWKKSAGSPERLLLSECVGCSDKFSEFNPIYKVKKGKFIHFGLKSSQGIQNLVFRKNGTFRNQFFMFEGSSQEEIDNKILNQDLGEYEVIESVYPKDFDKKKVYLELVEYNSFAGIENWYQTPLPTKLIFEGDFQEKEPDLPFKFTSGLYSFQGEDQSGEFRIINFFEPIFIANAVDFNENQSFESSPFGYYANATFFLISLEEDSKIEIVMDSNHPNQNFQFSILKNDSFRTLEEYLNLDMVKTDSFSKILKKGQYLIRVIDENSDFEEGLLYKIHIVKTFIDQ
ncbi:hypothetical protein [Algoriphagus sp. PAP.12]|uniref:hypothetical protein n=1 Tax=Algoriphagus sp. PAP.12 TaxID=2996678 RepID=UPI00227B2F71|nr:hypothetical protein [Algoriphagus sp. PAP.12]